MGPTSCGDSPYSSFSSFAGNPYFIDLDLLKKEELITEKDLENADFGSNKTLVDYGKLYENRAKILRVAFENRKEDGFEDFRKENADWLEEYALFTALKKKFGGKCQTEWPDAELRCHEKGAVEKAKKELSDEISFHAYVQYLFFKQWKDLKEYAASKGVSFIGDVPVYAALDSADVWSEPKFFCLDEENRPTEVAGVPPDAFSEDGQLWGNPLYDWEEMRRDGYGWWIRRIGAAKRLFDVVRIDHFRGFESYWAVPYGEQNAKKGKWKKGPGAPFVKMLAEWFSDLEFIAEDLGIIDENVRRLVDAAGFPGMKVLEFAFNAESYSTYLPHSCEKNSVCYVGTHDNDTVSGWLKTAPKKDVKFAREYMKITPEEGWAFGFIRTGMQTASTLFVMQMQDVLELSEKTRTNVPGTVFGNWRWRMTEMPSKKLAEKLYGYTKRYQRLAILPDGMSEDE